MFRRVKLPADPSEWWQDKNTLDALGFFINDQDQIRQKAHPDSQFQYRISKSDRVNETHREAFHIIVRDLVRRRIKALGIKPLFLPQLSTTRPKAPHVPIYATPVEILKTRKRVIVVVSDEYQDLGILAYRVLCGVGDDSGIDKGSCVDFIKELVARSKRASKKTALGKAANDDGIDEAADAAAHVDADASLPGLVILNPGQLLYSHAFNRPMTRESWNSRPRPSAVHESIAVDACNYIPRNESPVEHVEFVFQHMLSDAAFVDPDAELYVVGLQARSDLVIGYLNANWKRHEKQIKAIALMQPNDFPDMITDKKFAGFMRHRARGWVRSSGPLFVPVALPPLVDGAGGMDVAPTLVEGGVNWSEMLTSPSPPSSTSQKMDSVVLESTPNYITHPIYAGDTDSEVTQPTFSAGDLAAGECVFPKVYRTVLDWFEEVAKDPVGYVNPVFGDVWVQPAIEDEDEAQTAEASNGLETIDEGVEGGNVEANGQPAAGAHDGLEAEAVTKMAELSVNAGEGKDEDKAMKDLLDKAGLGEDE